VLRKATSHGCANNPRTASTVRCVVRHRRVPAPVQSADQPAQSRESVLVVSTITVIAKAHPSLPSNSRSRAHSSHLTMVTARILAEPASCLPVVSLIRWCLVLAPICPRRNSVRVRNMLSTASPALSKNIPASHDPKIPIGQTKNDLPHRTKVCRKNPRCEFQAFTLLPNLVIPGLPTCQHVLATLTKGCSIIPCGGVAAERADESA
jgi:hypothetical protein